MSSNSGSFSRSFSSGRNLVISGTATAKLVPSKRKRSASRQEATRLQDRPQEQDFIRKDGDQKTDKHLCRRCRTIDFEAIFGLAPDQTVTDHGVHVCDLGRLTPFSRSTACRLCSLFALIVDRNQKYENGELSCWEIDWYLYIFTTATLWNRSHGMTSRWQSLSTVLALSSKSGRLDKADRIECIDRGVILRWQDSVELNSTHSKTCRIAMCPKDFDSSRVGKMLSDCDTKHVKCREVREKMVAFPVRARVIDCHTRKVVPMTPECTYLALSYVWGPRRPEDLSFKHDEDSALADDQPSTIEDAITVTKRLGFQFLWVDRYCVDQRQNEDTQHQVRQMGNIYTHAHATICGLGENDNVGLHGVSRERKKQLRVPTQGMTLSWTGPSIRRKLQFSKWRRRGWTYQESVLSRRCLLFTEYYTALVCDSEMSTENMLFNYFHNWSFDKESELYGDASSWGRVLHPAQKFDKHLQEFQLRQLTYVADTLNAFKGVLSQLSVQSYWGISVYKVVELGKVRIDHNPPQHLTRRAETGFITGLCWKVHKSSYRHAPNRMDLPSWSWVGQKYTTAFTNCLARSYQLEVDQVHFSTFQASISACLMDNDAATGTKSIGIQEMSNNHAATKVIPEQSRFLKIKSVLIQWHARVNPAHRHSWVKDGLDAYQEGENGWWQSDYIGSLYLDPSYDDGEGDDENATTTSSPHEKCNRIASFHPRRGRICPHLSVPKTRTAVLLSLNVKRGGGKRAVLVHAVWLVIERIQDGTYRRRGLIVSSPDAENVDKARPLIGAPSEHQLKTVVVG